MDAGQKFQRIQDVERKREFERLTGENRQRGGFRSTIAPVHGQGATRTQAWTPGMQVPVRATFMGAKDSATAYAQRVRDAEWRERMAAREARATVGALDNLRAEQDRLMVALQAGLRMQMERLDATQRAALVQEALFGTMGHTSPTAR